MDRLSDRERETLLLTCDGLCGKEVAERMGVAFASVRNRLTLVYRTLGVRNRTQACVLAYRATRRAVRFGDHSVLIPTNGRQARKEAS